MTHTGLGFDAHQFGGDGPLRLGGVVVDESRGVVATSDGDVLIHAVIDAILGGANLGDIGTHFPSSDPNWHGADSAELLATSVMLVVAAGFRVEYVDATVIAQTIRVAPHRKRMAETIAATLGVGVAAVSIKATTTDGLGFLGRDEGIAALAAATLIRVGGQE
jgi:2-C-methyl-D-erythritol 2,4-cyclodiphosphate synthase